MIESTEFLRPPSLVFNPLVDRPPLSPTELLAGPFGLLAFAALVPLVLIVARWRRRTALLAGALIWLVATLRVPTTLVLLGGLAVAVGWIVLLGALRRRDVLSARGVIALVWIGLHALVLPLWWHAQQSWYLTVSRMSALHNVGFAYLMLRLIAWGTELARDPRQAPRLVDTACWLLYPPSMRLGPVTRRDTFLPRLEAWDPRRWPAWGAGLRRLALFVLGGAGLVVVGKQLPGFAAGADFFSTPAAFSTSALLRVFYLVPIQIYLILWTYNELAATLALWVGIPVDNNFDWLPRATSVRDFWRRWHITLGAWLRDYLYIPLGGNRRHVLLNGVIVFGYCGLWHGASWSFLAWGLSQAAALAIERGWNHLRGRLGLKDRFPAAQTAGGWLLTMHFQVAATLVFVDFDHLGVRLFRELGRRLLAA